MPNARYKLASKDIAVKLIRNSSTTVSAAGFARGRIQENRSHFGVIGSPASSFDHDSDCNSRSVDISPGSPIFRLLRQLVKVD